MSSLLGYMPPMADITHGAKNGYKLDRLIFPVRTPANFESTVPVLHLVGYTDGNGKSRREFEVHLPTTILPETDTAIGELTTKTSLNPHGEDTSVKDRSDSEAEILYNNSINGRENTAQIGRQVHRYLSNTAIEYPYYQGECTTFQNPVISPGEPFHVPDNIVSYIGLCQIKVLLS